MPSPQTGSDPVLVDSVADVSVVESLEVELVPSDPVGVEVSEDASAVLEATVELVSAWAVLEASAGGAVAVVSELSVSEEIMGTPPGVHASSPNESNHPMASRNRRFERIVPGR
jgi:hypothetical protein